MFLLISLVVLPHALASQTIIGEVSGVRGDGTVSVSLIPGSEVRAGILAHILMQEEEQEAAWISIAEVAIESVGGGMAMARIVEVAPGGMISPGDGVGVYEMVADDPVSLRVTPPQLELLIGETATLSAEFVDEDGRHLQWVGATWRSSQEGVVSINEEGRIVAIGLGEALVIGQATGGLVATAAVRVVEPEILLPDTILGFVGVHDTIRILLDAPGRRPLSPRSFRWSVGDPAVATVDAFGVMRPEAPGETTVQITGLNRDELVPLTVFAAPSGVEFFPARDTVVIVQGEEIQLSTEVRTPDGEVVTGVLPRIHDAGSSLLELTGDARIRGGQVGTTRLVASAVGQTHEWVVEVRPPGLSVEVPRSTVLLGDSLPLSAVLIGADGVSLGSASQVDWRVSDTEVAVADGSWLRATGLGSTAVRAHLGGASSEPVDIHVLGDLLLSVETSDGPTLYTLALEREVLAPLGADGPIRGWGATLSPDETRLAFVSTGTGRFPRIYLADVDGSRSERLMDEGSSLLGLNIPLYQEQAPVWSHDGRRIHFLTNQRGNYAVYSVEVASRTVERVTRGSASHRSLDAASKAPVLVVEELAGTGKRNISLMLPDGSDPSQVLGDQAIQVGLGAPYLYSGAQLLPEARGAIVIRRNQNNPREGDELVLVEFGDREGQHRISSLAPPRRDQEILFAVDPTGQRVAYVSRSVLGGPVTSVAVVDLNGVVQLGVPLPTDTRIRDLSWGAVRGGR